MLQKTLRLLTIAFVIGSLLPACGGTKRGCPTGANMGAERVLAGEKMPKKARKFKVKDMSY
jgi:hypothetical protein